METPDEARAKRIERNRRMIESWRAGESITEIAREHGLLLSWTGRLLRQEGAVLPPIRQGVRRADLPVAEIIREYDKGASMQALADKKRHVVRHHPPPAAPQQGEDPAARRPERHRALAPANPSIPRITTVTPCRPAARFPRQGATTGLSGCPLFHDEMRTVRWRRTSRATPRARARRVRYRARITGRPTQRRRTALRNPGPYSPTAPTRSGSSRHA